MDDLGGKPHCFSETLTWLISNGWFSSPIPGVVGPPLQMGLFFGWLINGGPILTTETSPGMILQAWHHIHDGRLDSRSAWWDA